MKPYLLGLNELDVDIRNLALHARGERDFLVVTVASWDEHERMRVIHEQKCQELCQAVEQISERQELLVAMMEG